MSYRIKGGFLLTALLLTAFSLSARAQGTSVASSSAPSKPQAVASATETADSDRIRDGLAGPVRRVRTEVAKLSSKGGKTTESARALLETASYDIKGNKSENAYYPVAGETLTGREVYKYDERGNISEMTLHGPDGSLVSKETYAYEFDFVGNWTKMTASIAVIEGGKLTFEPTEVTYRTIAYYLDENLARMVQPAAGASASTPAASSPASSAPAAAHANANTNAKPEPTAATAATSQKTGAGGPATRQSPALPAANTLDKINVAPPANLGSSGADNSTRAGATAGSVIKVDAAGEPPVRPKPLTKPVSGGVLNGSAIEMPKPEYPEIARRARVTGTISVEIVIDETGKVIAAHAASGPPLLREAAIKAAVRARFTPTKLSGQPVKVTGTLNYRFSYDQ